MGGEAPITVSVCIPTRDRPEMLRSLLSTVVSLDVPEGIEVEILVGDNSTDERSAAVCADFPAVDHRLNDGDIGAYGNFNSLLERATGDWVHLIADDDEVRPDYLVGLQSALRDDDAVIVTGAVEFIGSFADDMRDAHRARLARMGVGGEARIDGHALINAALIHGCPLVFSMVLIRRPVAIDVGRFPTDFRLQGDYELWLRLLTRGGARFVDSPVGALRAYEDNELEKDPSASREYRLERTLIRLIALAAHGHLLTPQVRDVLVDEARRELPRVRAFARLGYGGRCVEQRLTTLVSRAERAVRAQGVQDSLEPVAARLIRMQPRWLLRPMVNLADGVRRGLSVRPDGGEVGERVVTELGRVGLADQRDGTVEAEGPLTPPAP